MLTDSDRTEIIAMIRDEIVDAMPKSPFGGGGADPYPPSRTDDRSALTFEIRFLRRELEALTKQLHSIQTSAE
jgi:hypothetical protein